jgi:hypothetical protein
VTPSTHRPPWSPFGTYNPTYADYGTLMEALRGLPEADPLRATVGEMHRRSREMARSRHPGTWRALKSALQLSVSVLLAGPEGET